MGRYYQELDNDDFEGKFWFGTQSSTALDRFGIEANEPNVIEYSYDESDIENITKVLNNMEKTIFKRINSIEFASSNVNHIRLCDTQDIDKARTYIYNLADSYEEDKNFCSLLADYELCSLVERTVKKHSCCTVQCELE
jgi:hypothetical protein